jgi:hypothetical protein
VNDTVTNKLWWDGEPCLRLMHAVAPPESKIVGILLQVWLEYRSHIFFRAIRGTCPHDPLTVGESVYPGRFVQYARGHLMIHEWAGFSSFVLDPLGPHRIGVSVQRDAFLNFLSEHLTRDLVSEHQEGDKDKKKMEETNKYEEEKDDNAETNV